MHYLKYVESGNIPYKVVAKIIGFNTFLIGVFNI